MPFFRYTATDASGKAVQGTVQAATPEAAAAALSQKGITVKAWLDPNARHAIPAAAQPGIGRQASGVGQGTIGTQGTAGTATAPPSSRAPVRQIELSSYPVLNDPGAKRNVLPIKHTRRGSDKERFFLFTQIANLLRAGVNPHQSFGDMALRIRRPEYREAMQMVAQHAAEGVPISDVLASYPDLFPPHVVGTVRAGEVGGFLPEACTAIAQQAEAAHKFRISLWFIWAVLINAFLVIPVGWLTYRAFPRAYELTESSGAGEMTGGLGAIGAAFWELMKWPVGPVALIVYAAAYLVYLGVNSRRMAQKRHGWSLGTPILGGRAKNEGLSLFTWTLSKVAQAGVPPYRSWELGIDSVPNLALKEKLRVMGGKLHSGERLSTAFYDSKLFPDEYAPMMATAEMTGDVPGTLQKLSDLGRHEFEVSTTKSKAAAWTLSCSAFILTGGILLIFLVVMWYYRIPEVVLKGFEQP